MGAGKTAPGASHSVRRHGLWSTEGGTVTKKTWATPQLVVLIKGKPEETLLCHCKKSTASNGPNYRNYSCKVHYGYCCSCSDYVAS